MIRIPELTYKEKSLAELELIGFPAQGIIFPSSLTEYFLTMFFIIWGSDIMGIMISSVASGPNVAMTAMPFVLILQLVMSGVLFELNGWASKIANITFSKWGMSALGSIGDLNSETLPLSLSLVFPSVTRLAEEPEYNAVSGNLCTAWGNMIIISIVCVLLSIASLKIRNRKS